MGSFRKKVVIEDKAVVDDAVMKTAKEFEALHKAGKWKEAQELMDRLIARDPKFAAEALGAVLRRRQIATSITYHIEHRGCEAHGGNSGAQGDVIGPGGNDQDAERNCSL